MKRGKTERETCDLNGWGIGTRLIGDEGHGPSNIRITYFTESGEMLAVCETDHGPNYRYPRCREHFWTLGCREWTLAPRPVAEDPDWQTVHNQESRHDY